MRIVMSAESTGAESMATKKIGGEKMQSESRRTLLVVDDEPGVRLVLKRMLERLEYRVVTAASAAKAFEALASHGEICLVVLDLGLPDMKGQKVLERLVEMGVELPVLISSGAGADELDQLLAAENAVAGVLRKPFRMPELEQAVEGCLAD